MENAILITDTRQLFKNFIIEKHLKKAGLARDMGISKFHLGEILEGRRKLMPEHKEKLNELLGTSY